MVIGVGGTIGAAETAGGGGDGTAGVVGMEAVLAVSSGGDCRQMYWVGE